ncbi:3-oxoacyl-[acyl-carrier-protein] synthase III C-terminal domain-containing protein [Criblamydia sequanensis]|uniref:Chalcone/stilbene synthase domain-containing protein n=1 Tax=Candidatus Criblamydia sequanensis CRIB-18 TaxID=1437425 RepID=A0A090D007_9BACT|nr:3-oxoacyl-[acyl-carrier-protein] synthase III C-terminal domain-containing protein [Criblamydia sequanensis]CDR33130.1 chalcone/stilbene synthase domain-containing protein [Criblamydia sequanensis CRIB-18]
MLKSSTALARFNFKRPPFESSQQSTLNWISASHLRAYGNQYALGENETLDFKEKLQERIAKVACKPANIHQRGHVVSDFLHNDWDNMQIYRLKDSSSQVLLGEKQKFHRHHVDKIFIDFYENEIHIPEDLIHVSCTGYASPSAAQKIVNKKNWMRETKVTHLYHMGCYASIPAIRVGSSFVHQKSNQVDIVHTELCTLHYHPERHSDEDLVAQSLFADGFIKYSLIDQAYALQENLSHFLLLGYHEEQIPDSEEAMEWLLNENGFRFILAKEIPLLIAKNLKGFVSRLKEKICISEDASPLYYAIHPGGPKILEHCMKLLDIKKEHIDSSFKVLEQYGNMSSATLPHIWNVQLHDEKIPNDSIIISLGFGPGLTMAGLVLQKKESKTR